MRAIHLNRFGSDQPTGLGCALARELAPALGDIFPHPHFDVFVRAGGAFVGERGAREKPLLRNLATSTHGSGLARRRRREREFASYSYRQRLDTRPDTKRWTSAGILPGISSPRRRNGIAHSLRLFAVRCLRRLRAPWRQRGAREDASCGSFSLLWYAPACGRSCVSQPLSPSCAISKPSSIWSFCRARIWRLWSGSSTSVLWLVVPSSCSPCGKSPRATLRARECSHHGMRAAQGQ